MKIVHISDVHILNYRFHDEYKIVFEELYKKIDELKPDLIINTGDTAHTKLAISPSWVQMASNFIRRLSDFAPQIIILGNHDLNAKSPEKTDAISPIVEMLHGTTKHPIHFLKNSQTLKFGDFDFHCLSFIDQENFPEPTSGKINIALYHGGVKGALTDAGYVISHGEMSLDILKKYDYSLLGDIHHCQKLDESGKIRYAGNLVQFNFGESNDKGFLFWDIKDKDNFDVQKVFLKNPKPFETVYVDLDEKLKINSLQKNCRLRIVFDSRIPANKLKNLVDIAKKTLKPESVVTVPRFVSDSSKISEIGKRISENLRDLATQERYIREYVSGLGLSEQQVDKLLEINSEIENKLSKDEVSFKSTKWNLKKLEWSNLFSYGEDNSIDFQNLNGLIGQFSNNGEGKSSTWDILCLALFNTTAKNERKNVNVINNKKTEASCRVEILVDEETYIIERKYSKYTKTKDSIDAKVEVNFAKVLSDGSKENLNGESTTDTNKNIRNVFGTIEDFLLTSYSAQYDSFKFINGKWTERKETLGRFLELDSFTRKLDFAKEISVEYKNFVKKREKDDYASAIETEKNKYKKIEKEIQTKSEECSKIKKELLELKEILISNNINNNERFSEDIEEEIYQKTAELSDIETKIKKSLEEIEDNFSEKEKIKTSIKNKQNDLEKLIEISSFIKEKKNKQQVIELLKKEENKIKKDSAILEKVPCGEQFPECLFIKEAIKSKKELISLKEKIEKEEAELQKVLDILSRFNVDELEKNKIQIQQLENQISVIEKKISFLESEQNKRKVSSKIKLDEIEKLKNELEKSNKKNSTINVEQIKSKIKILETDLDICDKCVTKLNIGLGVSEKTIDDLYEKKREYDFNLEMYSLYEIYLKCVHPNGIPLEIIKHNLPLINKEIETVLSNCSNFSVFLDVDEKQLNILYSKNGEEPMIIELAGGAEKTLASFAIRLALTSITRLPISDVMILDEPATSFDNENLEGFSSTLEMIKSKFKNVILISHIDSLKDIVNQFIVMSKKDGFTKINQ